jgi:hypothetical protein
MRLRKLCCLGLGWFALTVSAAAQSLPPVSVQAQGTSLGAPSKTRWLFPLAHHATEKEILEFYGRDSVYNPADQVQFLYGFGDQQRKGLSADLMALIFPGGWRVGLGSSVSGSGSTQSTNQTAEEAIKRLRDGGDMYLTLAYPLIAAKQGYFTGYLFAEPRVNFLINGFGGTQTVTEATESTNNIGVEGSAELKDLESKGGIFVSGRWGRQHVSDAFKTATMLASANFNVFEMAIGVQFGDFVRVSFQRFHAPPSAAGVILQQLTGWHLVLQLAPTKKS